MNKLYYGANNTINEKIINNHLYNQVRQYKNIKYFENSEYLTFPTLNLTILQYIKSIIQTYTVDNKLRKILLFNIEQLDQECMTSLRILLEHFSHTTEFIATTTQITKIDKPILSRFTHIRVPVDKMENVVVPIKNIKIKPTIEQIKKLVRQCKKYNIKDIALQLLDITPYKNQFIKYASDIEHQYCYHNNKELAIESLLLVCFYPPNTPKI